MANVKVIDDSNDLRESKSTTVEAKKINAKEE